MQKLRPYGTSRFPEPCRGEKKKRRKSFLGQSSKKERFGDKNKVSVFTDLSVGLRVRCLPGPHASNTCELCLSFFDVYTRMYRIQKASFN